MHEFYDWQRFAARHPFPAELIDIHGGMQMALLANVHRDPATPPRTAAEFMVLASKRAPHEAAAQRPSMSEAERVRAQLMQGGG